MNRNYKVIWNQSLNCFMAVAEYAKSRGKSSSNVVSSTSTASAVVSSGARLLRLSAICAGLAASGLSMQANAASEYRGDNRDTPIFANTGERLNVVGGAPINNLSENNIGVIAVDTSAENQDTLTIKLAKDITGLDSVTVGPNVLNGAGLTAGETFVSSDGLNFVANGGASTVAVTRTGINAGELVIEGVKDGVIDETSKQAVNGSQLNATNTMVTNLTNGTAGIVREDNGTGALTVGSTATATTDNAIAMGVGAKATDLETIAIGRNASASGGGSVAIGDSTVTTDIDSVAIGNDSKALGARTIAIGDDAVAGDDTVTIDDAIAIGTGAIANGLRSNALGTNANAAEQDSTAIGFNANAAAVDSTAIGRNASANGLRSNALGTNANAAEQDSTAIGFNANAAAVDSTAIGRNASANGLRSNALGTNANAAEQDSTAIGFNANAAAVDSTAIGRNASANGLRSNAIGQGASATAEDSTAIGSTASATAIGSSAIGVNAIVQAGADNTVALGRNTLATETATDSVVIGAGSQVSGQSAVAIGKGSQANGNQSIAIGTGNIVNGNNSGAFGDPTIIDGANSYSVGNNNNITSNDTFVLGNSVTQTVEGSVVLGTGSAATTGAGVAGYGATNDAAIAATTSTTGAVAIGNASEGVYRQITGVAAGAADSDAVNVSQLRGVENRLVNNMNDLGYKINEVEEDANAGISAAMAMSSLPQAYIPGKSMIGGGVATYNGESAVAIGLSKVSDNGRWVMKINGTADTQGNAGGAIGAGFHF